MLRIDREMLATIYSDKCIQKEGMDTYYVNNEPVLIVRKNRSHRQFEYRSTEFQEIIESHKEKHNAD